MARGWVLFALMCCFSTSSVLALDDEQVGRLYEYLRQISDCSTSTALLRYIPKTYKLAYAVKAACNDDGEEFGKTVAVFSCKSLADLASRYCKYSFLSRISCKVARKAKELCDPDDACKKQEAIVSKRVPGLTCETKDTFCSRFDKPWFFVCYTRWARKYPRCACERYQRLLSCCPDSQATTTESTTSTTTEATTTTTEATTTTTTEAPTTTTTTSAPATTLPPTIEPDIFGTCGATCALKDLADELCAPGSQTGDCTSVPPELIGLYVCCTV